MSGQCGEGRETGEPEFDAVISVGPRHTHAAKLAIAGLRRFSAARRVFVLAGAGVGEPLARETGAQWVDEDAVLPGWTLARLKGEPIAGFPGQAPWYFQQFLKMAMARHKDIGPWYLLWDADSVLLRETRFFTPDGRAYLTRGNEMPHRPYFETYARLLGESPDAKCSFISQHAVVDQALMGELLDTIEARGGRDFVSAVLDAIRHAEGAHLFSEYETYAAFVLARVPERFAMREMPWLRDGARVLGKEPDARQLPKLARDYAFASFEHWQPRRWKYRIRYFLRHGVWV